LTPIFVRALLKNGVLIVPGMMFVTETGAPSCISSRRKPSTKPAIACFDDAYALFSGRETFDSTDDTQINTPPCCLRNGNAALQP
jgi:hypothetical protein